MVQLSSAVPVPFALGWGRWRSAVRCSLGLAAMVIVASSMVSRTVPASTEAAVPPASPAPRLADVFSPTRSLLGRSVVIGGLGSSVGAGATLQDGNDTPVAHFAAALASDVDRAGFARWTTLNESVPGSTIHDGISRDWAVLSKSNPDVVVLAYGMNDGAPAQFESGETYGGSMNELTLLIAAIRGEGAIPVLLTTPSAHTTRTNLAAQPGAIPQDSPIDTTDPVREVVVPGVGVARESSRHAAINAGMRAIATAQGVDLVDVEPYWLRAVAEDGEDALFDGTEFVHPNLLGHRLSYHAAIDAWIGSMSPLPPVSATSWS